MRLSIITINYNNKKGLQKTIDSVIAQTFNDFEWIIVDGGSTDGSRELIEQHQEYITYWCSEPDKGIYNAMNKGIKRANGEYCLFLNSGDCLHDKNLIESVIDELDGTDFVSGNTWLVNEDYNCVEERQSPVLISKYYLLEMTLCHQCTFIRTEILQSRPYDETLSIVADWEQMFYELIMNDRSYKHIDVLVSDYLLGGISEVQKRLLYEERKRVCDKYLTLCEQDEIRLEYFFQKSDKASYSKITGIAYVAFAKHCYSKEEYRKVFYKYEAVMLKYGLLYQRICVWLCLNGYMELISAFYDLLMLRKKRL